LRLSKVILALSLLVASAGSAFADTTESGQLLPDRIGKFRKVSSSKASSSLKTEVINANPVAAEEAEFLANGARVVVEMLRFSQDAYAYELLSLRAASAIPGWRYNRLTALLGS